MKSCLGLLSVVVCRIRFMRYPDTLCHTGIRIRDDLGHVVLHWHGNIQQTRGFPGFAFSPWFSASSLISLCVPNLLFDILLLSSLPFYILFDISS